jgi:hypothetical protein
MNSISRRLIPAYVKPEIIEKSEIYLMRRLQMEGDRAHSRRWA